MYPQFALAEVVGRERLPQEAFAHPIARHLTRMTSNLVGWLNDIFTLEKEMADGEIHNLVLVLMEECGMSIDEAWFAAVEQHNEEMRAFIALDRQLQMREELVPQALDDIVSMLRAWLSGHLDWARKTGRYRNPAARTLHV
jgi:5-epi-alpha-selinene synthase